MEHKRINEVKGVILIAIGLMVLASLIRFERYDLPFYTTHPNVPPKNFLGIFGAYLGGALVFLFGRPSSLVVPVLILLVGLKLFRQEEVYLTWPRFVGIVVLVLSVSSLIGMFNSSNEFVQFYAAGFLGASCANAVIPYFSKLGGFIIFPTLILLSLALVTDLLISSMLLHVTGKLKIMALPFQGALASREKGIPSTKVKIKPRIFDHGKTERPVKEDTAQARPKALEADAPVSRPKIQIKIPEKAAPVPRTEQKAKPLEIKPGSYALPAVDILDNAPPMEARHIEDNLEANARILEETLEDFGISAKVTDIEQGPVITRYELEPAPGVKLNKIVALGDDVALAMKAQSVRIIAPIPGKGRVGVEVPNSTSSFVYLKEVLESPDFQNSKARLPLSLGKDITGKPIIADLAEMPHLLIAGTTGSGKTVCVNSLILSLLYKMDPQRLKFVMVDPKMVELMPFNGIPHLLCPVVTESKKAPTALNWVVGEMEARYQLLAKISARNIESYNEKSEEKLPYIVVIVDEFADLMSVARDQIENAVTRLAQLSRAVGIHLLLATQRPSVDVITGVIKANLPARVSFKVASKVDSRTVLDMNGADKLLGKGDMLFMKPGESKLIRIQGTLIKDKEIERVVEFLKSQAQPVYDEEILREKKASASGNGEKDELFDEAVQIVMECNQASVSILQRRMRLGYTRAARIIDQMEDDGLVGPYEGSKPRKILVDRDEWMNRNLQGESGEKQ